jgi:hypothetical protein
MILLFKICCDMISKMVKTAGDWILTLAGPLAEPAAGAMTFGLTKCINVLFDSDMVDCWLVVLWVVL